jgi:hypothetical protein
MMQKSLENQSVATGVLRTRYIGHSMLVLEKMIVELGRIMHHKILRFLSSTRYANVILQLIF